MKTTPNAQDILKAVALSNHVKKIHKVCVILQMRTECTHAK